MCDEKLLQIIEDAAETLAAADDRCAALQKAVNAAHWIAMKYCHDTDALEWLAKYGSLITGDDDE